MWLKRAAPLAFLLLTGASPSPLNTVNETGQVMATLNDWRAILLVSLFLSIALLFALLWVIGLTFRAMSRNADALSSVKEAITAGNATMLSMAVTLARMESDRSR